MRIYFLRHGEAVEPDQWAGPEESRPLSEAGREALQREAYALSSVGLQPGAVLTSPLVRARQTAEVLTLVLGLQDRLREEPLLAPGFGAGELARLVTTHSTTQDLVLVGHEPDFSQTVGLLLGRARVKLRKGGVACVELDPVEPARGVLLWLATPELLRVAATA